MTTIEAMKLAFARLRSPLDAYLDTEARLALQESITREESQSVEPHGWMMQGSNKVFKGEFAELDSKAEAKRCGGTCYAYPVYLKP